MNTLEHKGFTGSIEFDLEEGILFGKVLLINDLVNYEGQTLAELKAAFEEAVVDYLAQCEASGKDANKPLSGLFNVRVGELLHRRAVLYGHRKGMNLNKVVVTALELLLSSEQRHGGRHGNIVMDDEPRFHQASTASTTTVVDQLQSDLPAPGLWATGTEAAMLMKPYFEDANNEGASRG
ncbi:type II toxin-antitoxin system HicB family antitoxin [Calothrix sp. FACHB-1219]|uniref:toxin-antitoxin system HicB family antitoxin n=1 Tax=Calothrix sp. FACHB-1219 TaxID=2692778 RepID=UPI00168A2D3C|nr:type II toxin-antitoxin system HicB family antitoxin [Calothrix sp. FACHB-1219]